MFQELSIFSIIITYFEVPDGHGLVFLTAEGLDDGPELLGHLPLGGTGLVELVVVLLGLEVVGKVVDAVQALDHGVLVAGVAEVLQTSPGVVLLKITSLFNRWNKGLLGSYIFYWLIINKEFF